MASDEQEPRRVRNIALPSLGTVLLVVVVAMVAVLVVVRFDGVKSVIGSLYAAVQPLLVGAVFAYLVNLIMSRYERHWFPKSKLFIVNRTRRAVCMILAILTVAVAAAILVTIIVREFASASSAIVSGLTATYTALIELLGGFTALTDLVSDNLGSWQDVMDSVVASLGDMNDVMSSLVSAGGSIARIVIDTVLGLIFMLYLLLDKERVLKGARRLVTLLPNKEWQDKVFHACSVANGCFSRFIFGQCLEATILGTLCALGGLILGFPYAVPTGVVVGMTSIIPYLGAWIGGIVGALMIFSVNPIQAVEFVVFLLILQQIEGHLIYPNVVGQSVGVPSIWVFAAVVAGGSLFGIFGVLLGVPVISTLRTLWMEYLEKRDAQEAEDGPPDELPSAQGQAS